MNGELGGSQVDLVDLVRSGAIDQVEERWMEAVEQGVRDWTEYRRTAEILARSGLGDQAGTLACMLLQQFDDAEPEPDHLRFALTAALLAPKDHELRAMCAKLHERAGRPGLDELLAPLSKASEGDMADVRERVETTLQLEPGAFVKSTQVGLPEQVVEYRAETKEFVLTDGEEQRILTPAQARAELRVLPPDDFRALLRFDLEGLKTRTEEDPTGVIRSALQSSGGRLEFPDLKKLFARAGLQQTRFTRWWNKAKGLVDRDPMIQVYGDKQPTLILRTDPISHEEELLAKIEGAEDTLRKMELVREYMSALSDGHEPNKEFLVRCAAILADIAHSESAPATIGIAAASIHEEVTALHGQEGIEALSDSVLGRIAAVEDVFAELSDEDLGRRVLEYARKNDENGWQRIFSATLPSAPSRTADTIAKALIDAGRQSDLRAAVSRILASPDRCGDGLLWLWRASASGSLKGADVNVDAYSTTMALLRLMNRWARARNQLDDAQASLLGRMRTSVGASNCKVLEGLVRNLDPSHAATMHAEIENNQGITEHTRNHTAGLLDNLFKDHIHGKKELWEQDSIFVSPYGLKKRQQEFDEIVNVQMVKNSEAIGDAASFGDLSENAEFTAALEQRDFLSRRANDIAAEIAKASVIPMAEVTGEFVNVGTRVRLKERGDGAERSITFLGPWDADLESGIYSYLAPFSMSFLGHKVGDTVTAKGEDGEKDYEILAIDVAEMPQ